MKTFLKTKKPPYIIAELSGNHGGKIENAKKIIRLSSDAGVDAIKLQTFMPDEMVFNIRSNKFKITNKKNIWFGNYFIDLYNKSHTPFAWHKPLFKIANKKKIDAFSSVFDDQALKYLKHIKNPIYKISSFENTDYVLLEKVAKTMKPIILSVGLASLKEITEGIKIIKKYGSGKFAILKCTSNYPANVEDLNLETMDDLKQRFKCKVGLSDHTIGSVGSIAASSRGADIIEKHVSLNKNIGTDAKFSLEVKNLKEFVFMCKSAYRAKGKIFYGPTKNEIRSTKSIRTLYYAHDLLKDHKIRVKDIVRRRPGLGIKVYNLKKILGKKLIKKVKRGTPVKFSNVI